jgi:propionyl-CoA carboxylase alpha chain
VLRGPVTNRELLIDLASKLTSIDDEVDTGWLDRQTLGDAPAPTPLQIAAAALAVVRAATDGSPFPISWRNNPSQLQTQAVGEHVVAYRYDRADRLEALQVDGDDIALDALTLDRLARIDTCIVDQTVFADHGRVSLVVPPRFVAPDDAGRAGSTVAPMPGKVVRLLVAVGDEVVAGQPLLTLEAMKMEHQVVSPTTGTVTEVFVHQGQQLDGGQPLVQVTPE